MHVNKENYEKNVHKVTIPRFRFRIGKRTFGAEPPLYDEIPCTCGNQKGGLKVVDVESNGKKIDIHFYRDCAKNLAYGIYARHFSRRTNADPVMVKACQQRTMDWIGNDLIPQLESLYEREP